MSEVTQVLDAIEQGEPHAAARLLPLVYEELRKLAAQKLAQEKPGQTLQPTALVHEAYLRLVGTDPKPCEWDGRGHFFAAAEAMRRILVDQARRKKSTKHGGDLAEPETGADLLALNEALGELARRDPVKARLVSPFAPFIAGQRRVGHENAGIRPEAVSVSGYHPRRGLPLSEEPSFAKWLRRVRAGDASAAALVHAAEDGGWEEITAAPGGPGAAVAPKPDTAGSRRAAEGGQDQFHNIPLGDCREGDPAAGPVHGDALE